MERTVEAIKLLEACTRGDVVVVEELLEQGVSPDVIDHVRAAVAEDVQVALT